MPVDGLRHDGSLEAREPKGPRRQTKVSVAVATFNQEQFIGDAIESAVRQITPFSFEVVVGDDASQDATREIIDAMAESSTVPIRRLTNSKNVGMARNLAGILAACEGEYVALLDGDDFWTSELKLDTQVRFLDEHKDCALCFHAVSKTGPESTLDLGVPAPARNRLELEDLMRGNPIPTCSVMFRNRPRPYLPTWWYALPTPDWGLFVLLAERGWIGYIPEELATYRIHSNASWSPQSNAARLEGSAETVRAFSQHLDSRYSGVAKRRASHFHFLAANAHLGNRDLRSAKRQFSSLVELGVYPEGIAARWLVAVAFRLFLPRLHRVLKRIIG